MDKNIRPRTVLSSRSQGKQFSSHLCSGHALHVESSSSSKPFHVLQNMARTLSMHLETSCPSCPRPPPMKVSHFKFHKKPLAPTSPRNLYSSSFRVLQQQGPWPAPSDGPSRHVGSSPSHLTTEPGLMVVTPWPKGDLPCFPTSDQPICPSPPRLSASSSTKVHAGHPLAIAESFQPMKGQRPTAEPGDQPAPPLLRTPVSGEEILQSGRHLARTTLPSLWHQVARLPTPPWPSSCTPLEATARSC